MIKKILNKNFFLAIEKGFGRGGMPKKIIAMLSEMQCCTGKASIQQRSISHHIPSNRLAVLFFPEAFVSLQTSALIVSANDYQQ